MLSEFFSFEASKFFSTSQTLKDLKLAARICWKMDKKSVIRNIIIH